MDGGGTWGGGSSAGGSSPLLPDTLVVGGVSGPRLSCSTNPVGTCCDYELCFTSDELRGVLGSAGAGGAQNEGGAAGASAACEDVSKQLSYCSAFTPGVTEKDSKCCYVIYTGGCCGRPFIVEGAARSSAVVLRDDWCGDDAHDSVELLSAAARDELAQQWAADGLLEHASIAACSRFSLELLQIGAPASLVEASCSAAVDESRHAQLCFALASRFGGAALGPTALALDGLALSRGLVELAVCAFLEGCIGETVAAAIADAQLSLVEDERCRAALAVITADEAEHSLLAWRFVRYALQAGGEHVAQAISAALTGAARSAPLRSSQLPEETANRFGRLSPAQERAVIDATWRDVIMPAAALLLEQGRSESQYLAS